jgi:succinate dehydrogenase hydrophobic anchor subunit
MMSTRHARAWLWTVGSGFALVVLAGVHMIAQHFVVPATGGLRNYQQVLDYIANPVMLTIEYVFLVVVVIHAMLGLRGILLDFKFSERGRRRVDRGLWALGTLTVTYGVVLLTVLATRA